MMTRGFAVCAGLLITAVYLSGTPASALTMKECSDKYKAAKAAGNTAKWNDFRKAECGSDSSATPAAAPATAPASPPAAEAKPAAEPKAKKAAKSETPAAPAAASGPAVFPTAVSPKYSSESAGKARMHTCLDQYNANKANNGNGGLNWIQKGGGYYSECNKKLKGA
jgi:hypothetical protein